ncbi:hypothetical protein JIQ42_03838 [Leishmania sp. Namibia]|uniref:hypothetical protein n=1 Tax=Leishmania sp. Namibia TaxID=2802991 RepID=UPI001B779DE3|nr:hypothetical protein JIQ42_03838 [Leishmania sp. Namibia]
MSARRSAGRTVSAPCDEALADRACAPLSPELRRGPPRTSVTVDLVGWPAASARLPAAGPEGTEHSPMPRAPPPTESASVPRQHDDHHSHDCSDDWANCTTQTAEGIAVAGRLGGAATPSKGFSAAGPRPCCQTEAAAVDIIGSCACQAPSPSTAIGAAPMAPSLVLPAHPPPSSSAAYPPLKSVAPALLTNRLSSLPNPAEASIGVGAKSASTPLSPSRRALHEAERRSVTVALDEHPLATLSPVLAPMPMWTDSQVSPSRVTRAAGADDLFGKRTATSPPMLVHDFASLGHAADEEMRSMGDFGGDDDMLPTSVATASAADGAARDTLPTLATMSLSSWQQPMSTRCSSGVAIVAVRQVSFAPANGACVLHRSSSGAASVTAPMPSSLPKSEKAAEPTPYPVTSTSSLQDWSSVPRLGFPAPIDPAVAHAEAVSQSARDGEERKREDKWYRLCRGVSLLASASPAAIVKLRAVAREYGIPHHLRGVMWLTLTGMALKVDENEYFCARLLRRNGYVTGPNATAIAADVQRTFPGHPYFSDRDVGVYKLTNVLHALCWRNPLLSYCQSFNFLAAFLLLVLDDEERAFWLLAHIFEELLPNDFYGESLLGANVEQAVLEHLVEKKLPRVSAKFREAGLQVKTLVANWIMSLFVNVFPISTVLHVWDYVFCRTPNPGERTPAHLEITLATLKYLDDAGLLSGSDAGELLIALRQQTACLFDAAALVRLARSLAIKPAQLHQLRRQCKPVVVEQMQAREQALAVQLERRVAQELRCAQQNALASADTS